MAECEHKLIKFSNTVEVDPFFIEIGFRCIKCGSIFVFHTVDLSDLVEIV